MRNFVKTVVETNARVETILFFVPVVMICAIVYNAMTHGMTCYLGW
jgi:hypothetical protein